MKRALWLLFSLAILAVLVWARWPEAEAPEAAPSAASETAQEPAATEAAPAPEVAIEEAVALEPEAAPAPAPAEGEANLRVDPKLAAEPLSEVPHELVGAWDDRQGEPELGKHRVLVAVVSPDASNAEIERLLRDVQARHRDAEVLDVRVYDSGKAARQAGWVGERKQIGGVKRNDRLDYEEMTVRGEPVSR
ncbi:MAG: hypothetical protein ABFS41_09895 [Myxococcota bacterium]